LFKKASGVSAAANTWCTSTTGDINSNKRAKKLANLKKKKKVSSLSACQASCTGARAKGCIAFNYYKKTKMCEVLKVVYKKQTKVYSGLPYGA